MPDPYGRQSPTCPHGRGLNCPVCWPKRPIPPKNVTNAVIQATMQPPLFTKAMHDQLVDAGCKVDMIGADLAAVEVPCAAKMADILGKLGNDAKPHLHEVRMNRDHYRALKTASFILGYKVGANAQTEFDRVYGGIKVVIDEKLTDVEYYDQYGNRMYPEKP